MLVSYQLISEAKGKTESAAYEGSELVDVNRQDSAIANKIDQT